MKNIFKKKFRIVKSGVNGYKVQIRHWFSPVYLPLGGYNWNSSLDQALELIDAHKFKMYVN